MDFPSGSVAKTPHFQAGGSSSIPGQGIQSLVPQLKILHAITKDSRAIRKIEDPGCCN